MKRFHRARGIALAALTAFALANPVSVALADESATPAGPMMAGHDHGRMQGMSGQGHDPDQGMMQQHQQMMQGMQGAQGMGGGPMHGAALSAPGQDAFGAIQEVVSVLDADPNTDWTKVDLEGLRQHLIDMNEVTLKADAAAKPIDGGIEVAITGSGRTIEAIQRMIPAHAHEVDQTHLNSWSAKTDLLPNGVLLTVTSSDPKETQHIRGLGFIGILASGSRHQPHHLALARGEIVH